MTVPTAEEIRSGLLTLLHNTAEAFMTEDNEQTAEAYNKAVDAVFDLAERRQVKLDTLTMLFG